MDHVEFVLKHFANLLIGFPNHRPGGLVMTVILSALGLSIGMALSVFVGSAQQARYRILRALARAYVQVFRGIPLVLLLLLLHNLLATGKLGFTTSTFVAGVITLTLYASAYQADIIASGIRSVPTQLIADARVMGASPRQAYLRVSLPYGLRIMRPALLSQAITLVKDSSAVVVLSIADLTTTAGLVLGTSVENAPFWVATYLAVGLLYFMVAFALSRLVESWLRSTPSIAA